MKEVETALDQLQTDNKRIASETKTLDKQIAEQEQQRDEESKGALQVSACLCLNDLAHLCSVCLLLCAWLQSLEKEASAASKEVVKETAAYSNRKETYEAELKERDGVLANAGEAKAAHAKKAAAVEKRRKEHSNIEKQHSEVAQRTAVSCVVSLLLAVR